MNDFRILLIKNKVDADINFSDGIDEVSRFEDDSLGITLSFSQIETDIGLFFKSFGIRTITGGKQVEVFGLDGVKEQLRKSGINFDLYHCVVFCYDDKQTIWVTDPVYKGVNSVDKILGNWARWSEVQPGTEFIEMHPGSTQSFVRILTHELRHIYKNRLKRRGILVVDPMDMTPVPHNCNTKRPDPKGQCIVDIPYYKELDMYAPDGNRAIANAILKPHVDDIVAHPRVLMMLLTLKLKVIQLILSLKSKENKPVSKLDIWAEAIKEFEGWYVGSRSYRNLNPGNLRWSKYQSGTEGGYAVFSTYEEGWKALLFQLQIAADGRSNAYLNKDKTMTLREFFNFYAPSSDNNHPRKYAEFVADRLKVSVDTPIYELI